MLEDKLVRLNEPKTVKECNDIFHYFGLGITEYRFENASQLVKVNNDFLSLIDKYKEALKYCVELGECQMDYGGAMDALEQVVEVANIALKD